jgi:hypothetical protein
MPLPLAWNFVTGFEAIAVEGLNFEGSGASRNDVRRSRYTGCVGGRQTVAASL